MIGAIIAKRKVRSALDALQRRDFSIFLADWREDVTFIYPGNVSASGTIKGKKAMEQWLQRYSQQFPKWNITVKNILVQSIFALGGTNVVAVVWEVALTNREGKTFQKNCVTTVHLKWGKAVLVRDYLDTEVDRKAWGKNKI